MKRLQQIVMMIVLLILTSAAVMAGTPVKWSLLGGTGDASHVHIYGDGSIVCDDGQDLSYASEPITGDFAVTWQTDWRRMGSLGLSPYPLTSSPIGTGVYIHARVLVGDPAYIDAQSESGLKKPMLPTMTLRIEVRNHHAKYFYNGEEWPTTGNGQNIPDTVRIVAQFYNNLCGAQAMLNVQIEKL